MLRSDISWPPLPLDWSLGCGSRQHESAAYGHPQPPFPSPVPEVHVWAACLEVPPEALRSLITTLSLSELERADRFKFEQHRNRFVVARGFLRAILGRCLQTDPRAVDFGYGKQGKPFLSGPFARSGLHFNLAHSDDLALIALTLAGPVGVDVEQVRFLADADQLVARFFSVEENATFSGLAQAQKPAAFFTLWTRKEAQLKATGDGIGSLVPLVHPTESRAGDRLSLRSGLWTLKDLTPAPGFAAAVAVAAANAEVRCWRYD
jgi:4'-phosphopantetheinyl transferase